MGSKGCFSLFGNELLLHGELSRFSGAPHIRLRREDGMQEGGVLQTNAASLPQFPAWGNVPGTTSRIRTRAEGSGHVLRVWVGPSALGCISNPDPGRCRQGRRCPGLCPSQCRRLIPPSHSEPVAKPSLDSPWLLWMPDPFKRKGPGMPKGLEIFNHGLNGLAGISRIGCR